MSTITFTYTQKDASLIRNRAIELGYKERIVDESLFVDGKIPMVQAKDEDGKPLVEMDYVYAEMTEENPMPELISSTPRLDEDGNEIPVMQQMDVMIDNPETPEQFIAVKAKAEVAKLLAGGIEKQIVTAATLEAERIVKEAKATAKATKEAVADSIEVTIK